MIMCGSARRSLTSVSMGIAMWIQDVAQTFKLVIHPALTGPARFCKLLLHSSQPALQPPNVRDQYQEDTKVAERHTGYHLLMPPAGRIQPIDVLVEDGDDIVGRREYGCGNRDRHVTLSDAYDNQHQRENDRGEAHLAVVEGGGVS